MHRMFFSVPCLSRRYFDAACGGTVGGHGGQRSPAPHVAAEFSGRMACEVTRKFQHITHRTYESTRCHRLSRYSEFGNRCVF